MDENRDNQGLQQQQGDAQRQQAGQQNQQADRDGRQTGGLAGTEQDGLNDAGATGGDGDAER